MGFGIMPLEFASKAHDLFKSSKTAEKRRIIALVFPNSEMNSAKLVFTLHKPFDMIVNLSTRKEWLCGGTFSNFFSKRSPSMVRKA